MSGLNIAIVGDGVVGRMAAAMLAGKLGGERVSLIATEPADHGLGPFGDVVALTPDFLAGEGGRVVSLDWLARNSRLAWSLGTAFAGWGAAEAPWFFPYGETGVPLGTTPFHQLVARARHEGRAVRLADHSLAALAAQAGRFAFPSIDRRSPRSTLALAAHVDVEGLAQALALAAERADVVRVDAPYRSARVADGRLTGIELADGRAVTADLYLDCTGAGVLSEALGSGWVDWGDAFPFDHMICRREPAEASPPYALNAARADGWTMTLPINGERAVIEAYTADAAPPDAVRFTPGVRERPWAGNCVVIGAGAMLIEPGFGQSLTMAARAVERLIELLPSSPDQTVERGEYNRLALREAGLARDAVQALYATNGRAGEAAWDAARAAPRSEALARKLALYASRGAVPVEDDELFEAPEWVLLLDGLGVEPRRYAPLAGVHSIEAIDAHFARLRARLIEEVRAMPAYAAVQRRVAG